MIKERHIKDNCANSTYTLYLTSGPCPCSAAGTAQWNPSFLTGIYYLQYICNIAFHLYLEVWSASNANIFTFDKLVVNG